MKKAFFHILSALLLSGPVCFAQNEAPVSLGFADSLRIVMENTRNMEATAVGAAFSTAWNNINPDQQQQIKRQTALLKKKGLKLRPHLISYFGAIAAAINIEGADAVLLGGFLKVTGKVIENYTPARTVTFFNTSRDFFERHTLFSDKSYRLYAREGSYTFEYLEFIPPPQDTTSVSDDQYNNDTWVDEPVDTVYHEPPPYWLTPAPQPFVEGAVIRFTGINLNFVTRYDSVFVNNTKGVFSLTDNVFVGEEGKFDWASANVKPEDVTCNLTVYNFNTKKPELCRKNSGLHCREV